MRRPTTREFPPGSGRRYGIVDAGLVYGRDLDVDLGITAQMSGIRCDAHRCVAALALKHELGAQDVEVGVAVVYVLETVREGPYAGQTIYVRWTNGSRRAIARYDDGADPPTHAMLKRPAGKQTLEAKIENNRNREEWPSTEKHRRRDIDRSKPRLRRRGRSRAGMVHTTPKEEQA